MGPYPDCEIKLCDLDVARILDPVQESIYAVVGTADYVGKLKIYGEGVAIIILPDLILVLESLLNGKSQYCWKNLLISTFST